MFIPSSWVGSRIGWISLKVMKSPRKYIFLRSVTETIRTLGSLALFKNGCLKNSSAIRFIKNLTCSVCFPSPAHTFHPCLDYELPSALMCYLWNHKAQLDLLEQFCAKKQLCFPADILLFSVCHVYDKMAVMKCSEFILASIFAPWEWLFFWSHKTTIWNKLLSHLSWYILLSMYYVNGYWIIWEVSVFCLIKLHES